MAQIATSPAQPAPADPQAANAVPATTPPASLPGLLVMPLKSEAGLEPAARALDELILTAIHGIGRYKVIGPTDLNALIGAERLRDAVGCDEVACAAELGGALGAPYLVAGQLGRLGDQAVLSLRLMDTHEPAVMARASARGSTDANALAVMMGASVGELFGVEVAVPKQTSSMTPVAPANDYAEFTALTMAISKRMMNNEYAELLKELDDYDRRTIVAPPSVSLPELLTFYRITACSMLKQTPCVRTYAKRYLAGFPQGLYRQSVESYVDQLDDAELQREAGSAELGARLKEIADQQAAGSYTPEMALELTASAHMGARDYPGAIPIYLKLLTLSEANAERAVNFAQLLSVAYEQTGQFAECRAMLEKVQTRHPKQFRLQGLHQTLKRLPK